MSESQIFGSDVPTEKPKAPGFLEQLVGVFTEPVGLFTKLHDAPSWIPSLIALIVSAVVMVLVWGLKVDVDALLRPILEQNPQFSAAQIDQIISMQSRFIVPFGILGALIATPILVCLMAFLRWLVGLGTAEGEKPSFLQAMSAVSVSSLTGVPYMLLIALMCLLRPVGGLAAEKLSPTSLAYYIHPENPKLMGLMTQVDLFVLAGFVMVYLSSRHTMRLKPVGAALCTGIAVLSTVVFKILLAK